MQNYAQDKPAASTGDLTFYLDQTCFAGNEGKTYVEFYLMFYADQLINSSGDAIRTGEIKVNSIITDFSGNQIATSSWVTEVKFENGEEQSLNKVIYDKWSEMILPGNYKIIIEASEAGGKAKGKLRKSIIVPKIEGNVWSSSEIEFVTSAEISEDENHLSKGNLKIIPNPSRRYGILIPKLLFHYEIYGIIQDGAELVVDYSIQDEEGNRIKTLNNVKINKPGVSASILHGIDVSNLKSGVHNLLGVISDPENNFTINISRQFEIIQAEFFQSPQVLSGEQAEIFGAILSYIGTSQQLEFFESLNNTGKAGYVIQYWKNLDPDPATMENEYLETIQKRFSYASKNFGWGKNPGWKTERARILIKYGMPDEIEQHYSESNTNPYEIWMYRFEKKYAFIFGDLQGNGRFVLLHSDKEGEVFNQSWTEYLKKI